jgi:hypothetical protein
VIDAGVDIEFSARRSLTWSAERSRQRSNRSVRFQSRTFCPNPSSFTEDMVSMTWACGFASPSAPVS